MLDIGWSELLLIGVVALIVVGPKELPGLFRNVGRYMGKARGMAREFQRSMEQAADDSGLNEAARGLKSVNRMNVGSARKFAETLVDPGDLSLEPLPDHKTATKSAKPAQVSGARDASAKPPQTPAAAAPASAPDRHADAPIP